MIDNTAQVYTEQIYSNLEEVIASYSFTAVGISVVFLVVLITVSLYVKKPSETLKKMLFYSSASVVGFCTVFLAIATVYLNMVSSSGGPVHWHADIEIWACGQELNLTDPKFPSNKIGTATLHEHNDKRIHLEGVVVVSADASLGKFFKVIGGGITPTLITLLANTGSVTYRSGDFCPGGTAGALNVFVYKTINGMYVQEKLIDPEKYIITGDSGVPPGDCIIVEFGEAKERTDKLCRSYKVAEEIGKVRKGGL